MIYHQSVYMQPDRLNTAMALLKEHLGRVEKDTGCVFGAPQFNKSYRAGTHVLNVVAELKEPMTKASVFCSETEIALMEAMWATLH